MLHSPVSVIVRMHGRGAIENYALCLVHLVLPGGPQSVHCTHHPTGDSKRRASTAPESAALPTASLQTRIFSNLLVKRSDPSYHRDRTLKCCHENIFLFVERTHCSQEVENSIARGEDVGSSRVIFRGRRGYAWGSIGEAAETLRASLAHGSCPLPALWCTKVQLCLHKFGLASFELRLPLRADDVV